MRYMAVLLSCMMVANCSGGNDAAQQAEIERLRAEAEKLRAEATQLQQENAQRQAQWEANAPSREFERRLEERYFGGSNGGSSNGAESRRAGE